MKFQRKLKVSCRQSQEPETPVAEQTVMLDQAEAAALTARQIASRGRNPDPPRSRIVSQQCLGSEYDVSDESE